MSTGTLWRQCQVEIGRDGTQISCRLLGGFRFDSKSIPTHFKEAKANPSGVPRRQYLFALSFNNYPSEIIHWSCIASSRCPWYLSIVYHWYVTMECYSSLRYLLQLQCNVLSVSRAGELIHSENLHFTLFLFDKAKFSRIPTAYSCFVVILSLISAMWYVRVIFKNFPCFEMRHLRVVCFISQFSVTFA